MPTYEYKCNACGHHFEEFQSITSPPIRVCPVCGEEHVTRLMTGGSGLIFKGSGFYITDYKKKSSDSNGATQKETKAESKKESPKTETSKSEKNA